jgi:hypothetical protein
MRRKISDPEMLKQAEIMLMEMPLRGFGMTGGVTKYGVEGLVDLVNAIRSGAPGS